MRKVVVLNYILDEINKKLPPVFNKRKVMYV